LLELDFSKLKIEALEEALEDSPTTGKNKTKYNSISTTEKTCFYQ